MELAWLSIADLGEKLRRGEICPVALTQYYLDRIAQLDGAVRAFITVSEERATWEARAAKERFKTGVDLGPLHGIPYAAKDNLPTAAVRTTGNSKALRDWVPDSDCPAIARLHDAGAILLGKLTMNEYGFGGYDLAPWARNPWMPNQTAGGSSNGAAAAVAAGLAPFALGTDGGGSIRIPASICGLVGLAPTPGRFNGTAELPPAQFDRTNRVGPLARYASDARLIESVLCETLLSTGAGMPPTVGRLRRHEEEIILDPDVTICMDQATDLMVNTLGWQLVEVEIPDWARASEENWVFLARWAWEQMGAAVAAAPETYSADLVEVIQRGRGVTAARLDEADAFRREFRKFVLAALESVDVLLSPTWPIVQQPHDKIVAPIDRIHSNAIGFFTAPLNLADLPAISVPGGFSGDGAPIGLQFAGAAHSDEYLIELAETYELVTQWNLRLPPLDPSRFGEGT